MHMHPYPLSQLNLIVDLPSVIVAPPLNGGIVVARPSNGGIFIAPPCVGVAVGVAVAGGASSSTIVTTPRPSAITAETGLPRVTLKVSLPSKLVSSLITTDAVAEMAPAGMSRVVGGTAP